MRIDYINGHDIIDDALWYVDGEFMGRDSQYEITQAIHDGESGVIDFHHRVILPELGYEDVWPYTLGQPLDVIEEILVQEAK